MLFVRNPEPRQTFCELDPNAHISMKFYMNLHSRNHSKNFGCKMSAILFRFQCVNCHKLLNPLLSKPPKSLTHWGRDKMATILQTTFSNAFSWILLNISLKFVPKVWNKNITTLVQIMSWCWPGTKPLFEPVMVSLLMHICVTRPQWVKQITQMYHCILALWTVSFCTQLLFMTRAPFTNKALIIIPAWISNHIHYKVWDEITYPFLNFHHGTIEVWEWVSSFISHFAGHVITYPCWDKS